MDRRDALGRILAGGCAFGLAGCTGNVAGRVSAGKGCEKPENPPENVEPLEVITSNGYEKSWTLKLDIRSGGEEYCTEIYDIGANNENAANIHDTVVWEPGTYDMKAELDNGEIAEDTREVGEETPPQAIIIAPDYDLNMGPITLLR